MIVWLASYPSSGNSFLRVLLDRWYGLSSPSQPNELESTAIKNLNEIVTSDFSNLQLVKTYDLPGTDRYPAIYLVRDGREALVSHARFILNHEKYDLPDNADVFWYLLHDLIVTENHFGGWAQNVTAWLERKPLTACIRYEDLLANPREVIRRALRQLKLRTPAEKAEAPPVLFPKNTWHDEMPEELQEVFWQHNGTVMEKLGYSKSGEIISTELTEGIQKSGTERLSLTTGAYHVGGPSYNKKPETQLKSVSPLKLGELQLFHDYSQCQELTQLPEVSDFYALLTEIRQAVLRCEPAWTSYEELVLYASVCFWMIRKLEYSFAARAFNALTQDAKQLNILDVGCGVVPLCNWMAKQDHTVTAIDPTKSHIEFAQAHMNDFYQSEVKYETVHAEKLPYPDATFDLITCISVLEHIPPGNDGLALLEIARVLKPGGHFILTFDVSPDTPLQSGERSLSSSARRFRYPFTQAAAEKLFEPLKSLFDFSPRTLITPFRSLTWGSVHQFWALTQHHDERAEPLREYLAAGIVMQRTNGKIPDTVSPNVALITGQGAIEQQLDFFEYHAGQRLQAINQLAGERDRLQEIVTTEVVTKDVQIKNLVATHLENQARSQRDAEERQTLIGETTAIRKIFEEQTRTLQQALATTHQEYQAAQQKLAGVTESLNEKVADRKISEEQIRSLQQSLGAARLEYQTAQQELAGLTVSLNEKAADRKISEEQIRSLQQSLGSARLEYQVAQQKLAEITDSFNAKQAEAFAKEAQLKEVMVGRAEDQTRIKKYAAERESLVAETGAIRKAFEGQIAQAQHDLKSKQQEHRTAELKLIDEIQKLNAAREKFSQKVTSQSEELTSISYDLTHYKAEAEANQSLAASYQRTIEEQTRVFQLQQEAHLAAQENANLMAEARLRVIEEQQAALAAYRRWSIKGRLKNLVQPQLGVLYQYAPKPIELPAKYRKLRPLANPPRISIVTPSYNQGDYIERTIQSVLGQDYPNLEYVIQDGASKDETMQVVEKYASNLTHYESVRDSGQTQAINLGFRHATGEIMAYLNSDDLLLPGALNYVASYFIKHPEIDVVYGHRVIVDEYDQEVGRWVMPPHEDEVLAWADYVPQETLFWRRRAWEKAGNTMDESFRFAMDWDLLLRLRDSGARMKRLPRFLGAFRVHPHQKTSAQISDIGNQEMARLRERCAKRPVSQAEAWQAVRPYLKRHVAYRLLHRINLMQ